MNLPSFEALKEISSRLKNANIKHALGGSGMMAYLGLIGEVHDWDITTDASREKVTPLIADLKHEFINAQGEFASEYLCKINFQSTNIDLIGGFAIKTGSSVFKLPTIVTADWDGVPVGSPGAWAKAYELMGRKEKAATLIDYIRKNL